MVIETLWPENAPWWLNLFIWMATFWWYILIGFVPAFYVAVVKLFGMPLLQRWSNEVVIVLYPSKVKFAKVTQEFEPYFRYGKGVYWFSNPLQPREYSEINPRYQIKLEKTKQRYEELASKESRTKKEEIEMKKLLKQQSRFEKQMFVVNPINTTQIFIHSVNQAIYDLKRRETKVDEILNNNPKPKRLPGHGIWIMQNPKLHFHRHYQIVIDPTSTKYVLVPVKEKQQFGIGFWHSLGIVLQKTVEQDEDIEIDTSVDGGEGRQLIQSLLTTNVIQQQMKQVQDYQNFSASRAFMLLKRRAKLEDGFIYWITGSINPVIFVILGGAAAAVAMIFLFMHGGGGPTGAPPTGGGKIL